MRPAARTHRTTVSMGERGFAGEVDDTLVFMDDDVVVERGWPAEVIAHPHHERTRAFLSEDL